MLVPRNWPPLSLTRTFLLNLVILLSFLFGRMTCSDVQHDSGLSKSVNRLYSSSPSFPGISLALYHNSKDTGPDPDPVQTRIASLLGPARPLLPGFTILTPSFKRAHLLPLFFSTYATGAIPSLKLIVIQWVDEDSSPDEELVETIRGYKLVPIAIVRPPGRSLNERFRGPEEYVNVIATNLDVVAASLRPDQDSDLDSTSATELPITDCILSLDDDLTPHNLMDIEAGYQTWLQYGGADRKRMVGFYSRRYDERRGYNRDPATKDYNIVLSKAAFVHRDWFWAYWSDDITDLRAFVHENRNCEDILLSTLISHHTHLPHILFDGLFHDTGASRANQGISEQPGHYGVRTLCCKKFVEKLGKDSLVTSGLLVKRG